MGITGWMEALYRFFTHIYSMNKSEKNRIANLGSSKFQSNSHSMYKIVYVQDFEKERKENSESLHL